MAELNLTFGNKWLNTDPLTGKFTAGEQNVDVWHITGPRMYGELDLSALTWAMVGATEHDTIASDEMQFSTDGDSITFVWNVSAEMTALPGKLSLHMVGTQGETEVIKIASNGTIVRPSLAGAFAPQLPLADAALNQIIANASSAAQSAQAAQQAAGQAQEAADAATQAAGSIGDAVEQAQTAAQQAQASQTAAAESAGQAAASAGQAQSAATQAAGSTQAAQGSATAAQESAAAAAGSATAAAGSAASAQNDAQAAQSAATAAQQAQQAAQTAASNAGTSETNAAQSASQAAQSAADAKDEANRAEGYAGQLGTAVSDKGVFDTSAALIAAYPNGTGTEGWYASVTETGTIWNYTGGTWADTGTAIGNNYEAATNKPSINGVELSGNKTSADLGLQPAGDYAASADLAAKANKPASPTAGNLAALDGDGNLADAGTSAAALQQATAAKADKVAGATAGNFAGLDANGNLTDSGSKAADFATPAQLKAKANRAPNPTAGHIATLDAQGNPVDSGKTLEDVTPADYDDVLKATGGGTVSVADSIAAAGPYTIEMDEEAEEIPVAANEVSYSNTGSGLAATNVQDAIDELENQVKNSVASAPNIVEQILNSDKTHGMPFAGPGNIPTSPPNRVKCGFLVNGYSGQNGVCIRLKNATFNGYVAPTPANAIYDVGSQSQISSSFSVEYDPGSYTYIIFTFDEALTEKKWLLVSLDFMPTIV